MSSMFDMQVVKGSGVAMPGDMNLPRPRFAVGTRVSLPTWKNDNLIGMCYRDAMRQMVADYRAHIARWRATGMSDEAVKLAAYECKQKIRFKLQTMRQADSIEVAGACTTEHQCGGHGRQAGIHAGEQAEQRSDLQRLSAVPPQAGERNGGGLHPSGGIGV